MHPPRTRPPSRMIANPLTAIVFLVFPVAVSGARIVPPTLQLTENLAPLLVSGEFVITFLWTCCRNVAVHQCGATKKRLCPQQLKVWFTKGAPIMRGAAVQPQMSREHTICRSFLPHSCTILRA